MHGKDEKTPKLVIQLNDGTMLRRADDGTYKLIEPGEKVRLAEAEHEQRRSRKKSVTLRMDEDLLEGYKAQGKGWQTLMHSVLKAYYETHLSS